MSESGKNRRDRATAARNAAQADEKRRERIVRIVGAVTVIVVVLGIIGVAVVVKNQSKNDAASPVPTATADPNAPLPKGALPATDPRAFGVPVLTTSTTAPVLEIWEDFQCPACEAVEKANGAGIQKLAAGGKIQLIYRPTTFLDSNLGNDASFRATAAFGCAIDEGKGVEYHNTIYANPPATEGDGFTDEQLTQFATDSGITGAALDTFKTCYADRVYGPWATNSTGVFYSSGIAGTPFALLNGVEVPTKTLVDPVALEALVAQTASGSSSAPSASASPSPSAS